MNNQNIQPVDFSAALQMMKKELRVMREGWNGKGQFVTKATIGSLSYGKAADGEAAFVDTLILCNTNKMISTWVPSIGDLMANDWVLYEDPKPTTLSDHQQLALEELEQITEKLESLTTFINDPGSTFSSLSWDDQLQLRMKANYQEDYARALQRIIDGLGNDGGEA